MNDRVLIFGLVILSIALSTGVDGMCTTLLKEGNQGTCVTELQTKLGISADGIFGQQTKAAVIRYQRSHGLTADGIVGPNTWAKLNSTPSTGVDGMCTMLLKEGNQGTCVTELQTKLGISADGMFGQQTKAAVIRYQRSHGLTADGIVGPNTWDKLNSGGGSSTSKENSGGGSSTSKETETLNEILKSEGGCQNWASDSGNKMNGEIGYTCAGIIPSEGYANRASAFSYASSTCGNRAAHLFVKCAYDKDSDAFREGAKQVYRENYFTPGGCSPLPQPVFYVCADIAVNSNPRKSKEFVNQLGPIGSDIKSYARRLNELHRQYYKEIGAPGKKNNKFLQGWLNRANQRDNYINNY